eukprot:1520256-Amphidinium_carterae.1
MVTCTLPLEKDWSLELSSLLATDAINPMPTPTRFIVSCSLVAFARLWSSWDHVDQGCSSPWLTGNSSQDLKPEN